MATSKWRLETKLVEDLLYNDSKNSSEKFLKLYHNELFAKIFESK